MMKNNERKYKVLVIDDDELVTFTWKTIRSTLNIETLFCFANLEELQKVELDLSSFDIAFIDWNITGSQFDGMAVIKYLKERGLRRAALASNQNLQREPRFAEADFVLSEKIPESLWRFVS